MRFLTTIFAAFIIASSACAADPWQKNPGDYQAKLGDCTSCHTAPHGKPFAGGLPINAPFGTIYSTNITPDKDYGIGTYSLADFTRVMREGITKDGHHLYPAMPYTAYAKMSDDDIRALYHYFMTAVLPVHAQPTRTKLIFPFNQRWGIRFWNALFLDSQPYATDPKHDAAWNRGAYLTQGLAHCSACHSPRDLAYAEPSPDSPHYLTGATLDHWYAPNLRGDKASGLGRWSEADIAAFLKTGHASHTAAFGSMMEVVENSSQYMTDDDRSAIGHYLKSFSAEGDGAVALLNKPVAPDHELPGAGLYASACAGCHQSDGTGQVPSLPALADNPAVLSPDPTSLIRILLEGGKTAQTESGIRVEAMPSFAKLTDREISEVVTYIRMRWGNQAPPVTDRDVTVLRKQIKSK